MHNKINIFFCIATWLKTRVCISYIYFPSIYSHLSNLYQSLENHTFTQGKTYLQSIHYQQTLGVDAKLEIECHLDVSHGDVGTPGTRGPPAGPLILPQHVDLWHADAHHALGEGRREGGEVGVGEGGRPMAITVM